MKPAQRVILYQGGTRPVQGSKSMQRNARVAKYKGIKTQCGRCKRYMNHPDRSHMADPANKTPCMESLRSKA